MTSRIALQLSAMLLITLAVGCSGNATAPGGGNGQPVLDTTGDADGLIRPKIESPGQLNLGPAGGADAPPENLDQP